MRTSNAGPIILHGPHQVAQKSATTILPPADSNTSLNSSCNRKQALKNRLMRPRFRIIYLTLQKAKHIIHIFELTDWIGNMNTNKIACA